MFWKSLKKAYLIFGWITLLVITITNGLIPIPLVALTENWWYLTMVLTEPLLIVLLKYLFFYIWGRD